MGAVRCHGVGPQLLGHGSLVRRFAGLGRTWSRSSLGSPSASAARLVCPGRGPSDAAWTGGPLLLVGIGIVLSAGPRASGGRSRLPEVGDDARLHEDARQSPCRHVTFVYQSGRLAGSRRCGSGSSSTVRPWRLSRTPRWTSLRTSRVRGRGDADRWRFGGRHR